MAASAADASRSEPRNEMKSSTHLRKLKIGYVKPRGGTGREARRADSLIFPSGEKTVASAREPKPPAGGRPSPGGRLLGGNI